MILEILTDPNFLKAIITALILIILGFILKKTKLINNKIKDFICFIVLKITLPVMAFYAFLTDFDKQKFNDNLFVFFLAFLFFVILLVIGDLIFKRKNQESSKIYAIFITVGQLTFFSVPVLKAIYGNEIMLQANMVTLAFRFILYIYCYFVISKLSFTKDNIKTSLKQFLLNPIMIAMFLGMILWLTQNETYNVNTASGSYAITRFDKTLPFLYKILYYVQWTTTPLAMLVIGFSLGDASIGEAFKDKISWILAILRTLMAPLFVLIVTALISWTKLYVINELTAAALVLGFAAPLSAVINTYCYRYNNEKDCASRTCFLSTILCVINIPILYTLLKICVKISIFC